MDLSGTISYAAPSKVMNDLYQKDLYLKDLYQKINKYAYEIRMMELYGYLYGMNRQKIDKEKAYDIIIDAHDSHSNPLILYWKALFVDTELDPKFRGLQIE